MAKCNFFMEMLRGNEKHFYRTHTIPEKGDPDATIVVSVLQPCAPPYANEALDITNSATFVPHFWS